MKKKYMFWNEEKVEQFLKVNSLHPVTVLCAEARQGVSCSTVVECDEDMVKQIKTLLTNETDIDYQCVDISQKVELFIYRGCDYESAQDAQKDGALYYTGVSATLEGLGNPKDMNTIAAIVRATSSCINNDMSEIKMVWMDESTTDVMAPMEDLL